MISDYQYERLSWLLDEKELDQSELGMIDSMLATNWYEHEQFTVTWLMEWLRRKPRRIYFG